MKANLKNRVICYIVDLIIISIIGFIISITIPKSATYTDIQNQISNLSNDYLNSEINFGSYFSSFSILANKLDKANILYMSIYFFLTILYFIIIPLFLKGKTFGMMFCQLKLELRNDKSLFMTVLLRSFISYGILFYLLQLCVMYFVLDKNYLIILTILAFIQILVVICGAFMIKYRDDKRSLADILSNSNIFIES